jgi:hypothetical protein
MTIPFAFSLLELWFLLSLLFVLLLAGMLLWYALPTLKRMVCCPWCWRDAHLLRFFPENWPTGICAHHARVQEQRATTRRLRRLAREGRA